MPRPAVFVSGLPRSGTSLLMQIIQACGIAPLCDDKRTADKHNPEGYFELEAITHVVKNEGVPAWYLHMKGHAVKAVAPLITCVEGEGPWLVLYAERPLESILASQKRMLNDPTSHNAAELYALRYAEDYTLSWLSKREHTQVLRVPTPLLMTTKAQSTIEGILSFLAPALLGNKSSNVTDKMLKAIRPGIFSG